MNDQSAVVKDQDHKRRLSPNQLRLASRLCVLLAGGALLLLGNKTIWPVLVPALSPQVSLASLLATRAPHWFSWIGIALLFLVAWRQRWFCRWLCPTGLCADQASWVGRRLGRERGRWPAIGQWIALLTLTGACVGYPLLLWLDPLALLGAAAVPFSTRSLPTAWWYLSGITGVLLLSLVWPNAWCTKLCPLGGLQDAAHGLSHLVPPILTQRGEGESAVLPTRRGIRRRTLLGAIFGIVWASATLKVRRRTSGPLRPPGSVSESQFPGLCIRCGNCSRACPTNIITHTMGEHGVAGLLTPKIEFQDDYCLETCNQCTLVCPSGAIQPVALGAKIHTSMGTPVVDMDLCLLGEDRECSICRNRCPYEAIRLEFSEEFYTLTPRVDFDRCPGCGACQVACPTQPVKAIVVQPLNAVVS